MFIIPYIAPHVCLALLDESGDVMDSRCWRKVGAMQECGFEIRKKPPPKYECAPIKKESPGIISTDWRCIADVFDSCKEKYHPLFRNCRHLAQLAEKKCLEQKKSSS